MWCGRYLYFKNHLVEVFGAEAFTACKSDITELLQLHFPVPTSY